MPDEKIQRAAIILASLDEEAAAEICRYLDRDTVQKLATQIAHLHPITRDERNRILRAFLEVFRQAESLGGREYAQHLLNKVLGTQLVDDDLFQGPQADLRALQFMAEREPHILWRALEHETRQVQASALAQLRSREAARLLELIPETLRTEIAYRAANLGPTSPGAIEALARSLVDTTHRPTSEEGASEDNGLQFLLEILQNVERSTEKALLEGLKQLDEEFAGAVEEHMVTFEDLFHLDDRALQVLLRQVEMPTLALALRGVDDLVKERALSNVSARMREEITQEMELMGPVRVAQVEAAQRVITNQARDLSDAGELELRQEQGEYI